MINLKEYKNYVFWRQVAKFTKERFPNLNLLSDETEIEVDAMSSIADSNHVSIEGYFKFSEKRWGKLTVDYNPASKSVNDVRVVFSYDEKVFEENIPKFKSEQTFEVI